MGFTQRTSLLGQITRCADIRWKIAQIAGKVNAFSNGNPALECHAGRFGFPDEAENDPLQAFPLTARFALETVEPVCTFECCHRCLHRHPFGVPILDGNVRNVERGFANACFRNGAYRAAHTVAIFLRGRLALGAKSDQQHTLAAHAGQIVKHQGRSGFRLEIALLENG